MIFSLFNSRPAVDFAKTIAQELNDLLPPTQAATGRGKEIKKLERLFNRIYNFSQERKLGFYGKAKFLNTLRWELKERGYSDSDISHLTGIILPKL